MGDELPRQIGPRVNAAMADPDAPLCRPGGEEFALLLSRRDGGAQVKAAAQRVVEALRAPFAVGGMSLELGARRGGGGCMP